MSSELVARAPGPHLAGVVIGYTGFAESAPAPVGFRELPCTYVPLIIDLGDGWSVGDPHHPARPPERLRSFVAGLTDGPVGVEHPGTARCLQVDLTPLGARRLLGMPMSEIANRSVGLEDVLGPSAGHLAERLDAAPGWDARIALVEHVVAARLARSGPADPGAAWALGRLSASGGRVPIGDLARELGWSHRRLIARFRAEVGLPPKTVARIVRFERLRALLGAEPGIGLARAAAGCGFSDQAHLAREVRDLAGITPSALRDGDVNYVQDHPPGGS